jgi:hypothetical protein
VPATRTTYESLGKEQAKSVYYAIFESVMKYGICFWGFGSKQNIASIFKIQKRAIRIINGAKYSEHCKPYFISNQILTLHSLFILEMLNLIYKNEKNILKLKNIHEYCTRNRNNLALPLPKCKLCYNSPIYIGRQLIYTGSSKLTSTLW